ncbi:MAG TPA: glycoside hydrolase family 44 protein [Gemmatimonadaceae bacterium]|nr:glycoside hydrolase family 44 protein [Gemmatimonadaceae bacterium]
MCIPTAQPKGTIAPIRLRQTAVRLVAGLACLALGSASACTPDLDANQRAHWSSRDGDVAMGSDAVRIVVRTAIRRPISRYIYGANFTEPDKWGHPRAFPPFTLNRLGGNRMSAYNWENNYSNAGNDYQYENDEYLSTSRVPGEAIRSRVAASLARHEGVLVTVPMLGEVAADGAGPMEVSDFTHDQRMVKRFKISRPAKPGALSLAPDTSDAYVYQDEFVHWLEHEFPDSARDPLTPIFFSLDNEPDLWSSTHEEVNSKIAGLLPHLESYQGFIDQSVRYARAIKRVAPDALVFGPALSGWVGMATLGRYPEPDPRYGSRFFLDVYLDGMRQAEAREGKRLLDVLDLHWYPQVNLRPDPSVGEIEKRLQLPRSLWDPSYDEGTWVTRAADGPIRLLPRVRQEIARHYPGTKLAITEYYYGGGNDISGGIVEADVLGIFGREGVFAANLWPVANLGSAELHGDGNLAYGYIFAAFDMFLNYDGAGGRFGDTGVEATTSDPVHSSAYASVDSAGHVVIVAINKTRAALPAAIQVVHPGPLHAASVYTLTGTVPAPRRLPDVAIAANNTLLYRMPPMSVSTLVMR